MKDYGAPYGERPEPEPNVGKPLGCYGCEGEFASADELSEHEHKSGHGHESHEDERSPSPACAICVAEMATAGYDVEDGEFVQTVSD